MDEQAAATWKSMLKLLETRIGSVLHFDIWIKTLEPINVVGGKLVLLCPGDETEFIVKNFYEVLFSTMKEVNPLLVDVVVAPQSERETYASAVTVAVTEPDNRPAAAETKDIPSNINPKYNFENFVVGKSNQFVYAAARAVSEEPGARYNPLFIYGGVGLGKTHIMHAIGNAIHVNHPTKRILYVSSEKFLNEFIESIRTTKEKSTYFRDKYRSVDVLMIDDIQFISGKSGIQEEMFHTFNDLYQANKQLVFTSDCPPKKIPDLEERLCSRFEWGLIADIQAPDLETRIAILQKKAQLEKHNLPLDVLTYMAEKIDTNIREMESLLNKVTSLAGLTGQKVTVELVNEALKDYGDVGGGEITVDDIIDNTCRYYNVSRSEVLGKKRTKDVVEPRQMCMYLMIDMLALPLTATGAVFGGKDHTTVMYNRDKLAEKIKTNPKVRVAVEDIKNMIYRK